MSVPSVFLALYVNVRITVLATSIVSTVPKWIPPLVVFLDFFLFFSFFSPWLSFVLFCFVFLCSDGGSKNWEYCLVQSVCPFEVTVVVIFGNK